MEEIIMKKIVPHLWFDKEAKEAAELYVSLFEDSRILNTTILENTPSGEAELVSFELSGQPFEAISAGPFFSFNPSISFMVACYSIDEVDRLWKVLSEGGEVLMPLGEYPFSKKYGWVADRYGLSWQLMLTENSEEAGIKITPNLLFSSESCGKAEEAIKFYTGAFEKSSMTFVSRYAEGEAQNAKAKVNYAAFNLADNYFCAMDNGFEVDFGFNEAISFIIYCEDQKEIDDLWSKLSAEPEAEQCGWLKDQYGVSWQVVPTIMSDMLRSGDPEKMKRIVEAFLKMKKFDIETLKQAYQGNDTK